jgi:membrane protein implicated in regulation of membrane protease activity
MFEQINPWVLWGIVAIIFFILEVFVPSFWIAILGIGAIAAGFVSYLGGDFTLQIAGLSVVSIVCGLFLRPLALKYIYRSDSNIPTNTDALIGRKVSVITEISYTKPGRVKIGGETWKALVEQEDQVFSEGSVVTVKKVDGAKVIVDH